MVLLLLFVFRISLCNTFVSVPCILMVTCCLGSLVSDVFLCFVTFSYGVLAQVWYLIVSIPNLFPLPYFATTEISFSS